MSNQSNVWLQTNRPLIARIQKELTALEYRSDNELPVRTIQTIMAGAVNEIVRLQGELNKCEERIKKLEDDLDTFHRTLGSM